MGGALNSSNKALLGGLRLAYMSLWCCVVWYVHVYTTVLVTLAIIMVNNTKLFITPCNYEYLYVYGYYKTYIRLGNSHWSKQVWIESHWFLASLNIYFNKSRSIEPIPFRLICICITWQLIGGCIWGISNLLNVIVIYNIITLPYEFYSSYLN